MAIARFLAPALALGLLATAVDANAGTLTLRDEAQVLTPGDAEQLRAIVAKAPFDARLATTTAYADQAGFSHYIGMLVSSPDMVAVGIDPQHHHVQVHFGTGSHIPQSDWPAIERAGNDAFKRGAWEEGGAAIFRAASTAAASGGAAVSAAPAANRGGMGSAGLIIMIAVGVILAGVLYSVFASRRSEPYGGGMGYGGGGPYPGAGGPGPYYGQGGGAPGGMGPMGGGLIGAGLGGLAGYELGKMAGEHEHDRGQGGLAGNGDANAASTTSDNGSYDAGGGGSGWDSGSDSGGGGSDFDSGGGGDFGGGGDGGGGGDSF